MLPEISRTALRATRECSKRVSSLATCFLKTYKGRGESDPFSRAPPRHVSAPKKDCPRTEVFSAQSASNALRGAQGTRSADRFRSHGGSVQDSSNATHEEVRNAMGRARRPSHSILPRSRAEQSLRASLDPARTYLQGGGYDSRQCRADTQLAMIGVSMRVTPNGILRGSVGSPLQPRVCSKKQTRHKYQDSIQMQVAIEKPGLGPIVASYL